MKITLTDLIKTLSDDKDYTKGTQIVINRNELTYDNDISSSNVRKYRKYYRHNPTGAYLCVQHNGCGFVSIYLALPTENHNCIHYNHFICEDKSDDLYWDNSDDDFQFDEFDIVYKDELY